MELVSIWAMVTVVTNPGHVAAVELLIPRRCVTGYHPEYIPVGVGVGGCLEDG